VQSNNAVNQGQAQNSLTNFAANLFDGLINKASTSATQLTQQNVNYKDGQHNLPQNAENAYKQQQLFASQNQNIGSEHTGQNVYNGNIQNVSQLPQSQMTGYGSQQSQAEYPSQQVWPTNEMQMNQSQNMPLQQQVQSAYNYQNPYSEYQYNGMPGQQNGMPGQQNGTMIQQPMYSMFDAVAVDPADNVDDDVDIDNDEIDDANGNNDRNYNNEKEKNSKRRTSKRHNQQSNKDKKRSSNSAQSTDSTASTASTASKDICKNLPANPEKLLPTAPPQFPLVSNISVSEQQTVFLPPGNYRIIEIPDSYDNGATKVIDLPKSGPFMVMKIPQQSDALTQAQMAGTQRYVPTPQTGYAELPYPIQ
jgi:hypothetical protein